MQPRIKSPISDKAFWQLKHVFNLLGLRIIPGYFLEANKPAFQKWQYNACNQTALITSYMMMQLLTGPGKNNSNPFFSHKFTCDIYEGIFTETHGGNYNHAYIFLEENTGRPETHDRFCFFVDVARISNPTVFEADYDLSPNPEMYSYNYTLVNTKKLDGYAMMYQQPEFYTGMFGLQICHDIENILLKLGYNLPEFNWNV